MAPRHLGYAIPAPMLGVAPHPPPGTSNGILAGVTMLASGVLATVFLIRVIGSEKNPVWKTVGFAALGGSAIGALHGLARILTEFTPERAEAQKTT